MNSDKLAKRLRWIIEVRLAWQRRRQLAELVADVQRQTRHTKRIPKT